MQDEQTTQNYSYQEDSLDDLQSYPDEFYAEDSDPFLLHPNQKPNALWRLFMMQCGICAMIIALFGGMKMFRPDTFETAKTAYHEVAKAGEDFRSGLSNFLYSIHQKIDQLTPLHSGSSSSEQSSSSNAENSPAQDQAQPSDPSQPQSGGEGGEPNQITTADAVPANCRLDPISLPFEATPPLLGRITSAFGSREYPLNGNPDFHIGIDIAAEEGTPIAAMSDGVIQRASFCEGYGNYVKIKHAENFISLYAHCSALAVSEGQTVVKGQIIAYVGSTGASTGNHLHFGVQKDGIWYNPAYIFPEYR